MSVRTPEVTKLPDDPVGRYFAAMCWMAVCAYPDDHAKRDKLMDGFKAWGFKIKQQRERRRKIAPERLRLTNKNIDARLRAAFRLIFNRRFPAAEALFHLERDERLTLVGAFKMDSECWTLDANTRRDVWRETKPVLPLSATLLKFYFDRKTRRAVELANGGSDPYPRAEYILLHLITEPGWLADAYRVEEYWRTFAADRLSISSDHFIRLTPSE